MGSKPASVYTPPPVDPKVYQSVIPQSDFDASAKYVQELKDRVYKEGGLQDQIYAMTGAPVKANVDPALLRIGESKAATDTQARKTYAASIAPGVVMDQYVNASTAPKLSNYSNPTPPATSSAPQQEDPRISASNFANKVADNADKTVYTPAQEAYAAAAQKVAEAKANPEPKPEPVQQQEETPKVNTPAPQQTEARKLKPIPISNLVRQGQSQLSYGNIQTYTEKLKYAKKHNMNVDKVSWENIGYDSNSIKNGTRPEYDDKGEDLNTLGNG